MNMWWPLLGFVFAAPTLWGISQDRSPRALVVFASGVAAFVGVSFWPPSNGVILDRWVGTPGAGRLIAELTILIGTICHYLFAAWDKEEWTRRTRVLAVGWVVSAAVYIGSWVAAQRLTGYNLQELINHRYVGAPWPLLLFNVSMGLGCAYCCGLCALVYHSLYRMATQKEERQGALLGMGAYLLIAAYGGVVVAQTVLDRVGIGTATLPDLTISLAFGIGIVFAVSVTIFTLTPVGWSVVRGHLSLSEREARLVQRQQNMVKITMLLNDLLVAAYGDPTFVQAVERYLSENRKFSAYQRRVGSEAARLVSLLLADAIHVAWYVQEEWVKQDVATATAPTLLRKAEADADFYGDVLIVVTLVLKTRRGPGIPLPRSQGWHQALAAIILAEKERRETNIS